ncbi:hypothetical protein DIZ27_12505 [Streptomyces sp. NWU339]|uniref:hypothetical protein n=1 Tax=Streptomyces sp. NWU339 TaxID=2185284 RepID=UPI000D67B4AE|nr:hypothetical protein [Streptomyces sp. NWU339]PWI10416.1 hypothetical protein DIZ27_12505 [Streptomyces sp. NWU339]
MHGVRHPYTKDLYELDDQGRVRVTSTDGDHLGYFSSDGRWLAGDKFDADPHLCGWVSAPRKQHRISAASR